MLTCLLRGSKLTLTPIWKDCDEMRLAAPDYFLNVPALLERMRKAVDEQLWKTGGFPLTVYTRAKGAWVRRQEGKASLADRMWLGWRMACLPDDSQEDDRRQVARARFAAPRRCIWRHSCFS